MEKVIFLFIILFGFYQPRVLEQIDIDLLVNLATSQNHMQATQVPSCLKLCEDVFRYFFPVGSFYISVFLSPAHLQLHKDVFQ